MSLTNKDSIIDPSVKIMPSSALINFIVSSLSDEAELPENILKIYKSFSKDIKNDKKLKVDNVSTSNQFSLNEIDILKKLNNDNMNDKVYTEIFTDITFDSDSDEVINASENIKNNDNNKKSKTQTKILKEKQKEKKQSDLKLNLFDIKWINGYLMEKRKNDKNYHIYLHDLLQGSQLKLPKNPIIKRNPILEARCERLRLEQNARLYNAMTKNVDCIRRQLPEDTISYQSLFVCFFFLLLL